VKTYDDTFTTYFADGDKGIRYSVSTEGLVEAVTYLPSVADNTFRCPGFPLFDGGVAITSRSIHSLLRLLKILDLDLTPLLLNYRKPRI
jgi:hypothetical protein